MSPGARLRGACPERAERVEGWLFATPALIVILLLAMVPIAMTGWEALHGHDLRFPWLGRPFIGLANIAEAAADPRVRAAVAHTVLFALVSVPLELALGLLVALLMHASVRGRGVIRVAALLPWAVPTVVVALIWRFMFDAQAGIAAAAARGAGLTSSSFDWFVWPIAAWVPIVLADVWKTTPFVAILLLAGLQMIDPALDEAARLDGATPLRRFTTITLPLLLPTIVVAGTFRLLDALRVFDLVYVLTRGGPGTATEPLSLYAFVALTERLRFGYGSSLSMTVFVLSLVFALAAVALLNRVRHGAET